MPTQPAPPSEVTDAPFGEALRSLRAEAGWTLRELATRTRGADPAFKGLSNPNLSRLERGEVQPLRETIELLARTFGRRPEFFAEYRLLETLACLDWREVGVHAALQARGRVEAALHGAPAATGA